MDKKARLLTVFACGAAMAVGGATFYVDPVAAPGGDGPVRLDLSRGACKYDCDKCSSLCPTGALLPLTLKKKQRTKIAEAAFDAKLCLACHGDAPCGKCADACPAGAIKARGPRRVPRLNKSLCIGCGACQAACPAKPKAMTVHGIRTQDVTGS